MQTSTTNHTASSINTASSTIFDLAKNTPALITEIVSNERFGDLDGMVSQRLKDLGFLPNTPIRVVAKGLFGRSPYAVQLGSGIQFSLRTDELVKIRCRVINNE